AGLIGDDSKTKTLFSEGYGVYYTYGEPVTAGALTSSSGESDAEIHHEIQKDELDYLQPGDILFFTSTGDRLFTPGSPTVARMIGRDKVLNIGHLGVYYGKKDDKCHEYMEASGILNDGAQCGACNGGDCKVVKKCLETRMGWKDGKRHVFATRIGGTVALSAAQPESKLVILDITNVSETSPLDAGARANLVDDFSKKLEATLKTSGVSVAVIDKSADELMDYADKNFENDSEGKKNVYESLGINGDVYVKISATEKGEFVASYKVKDVTAYNKNLALVGAIIKTYKTKVLENSQPIHSRVLSKNIPAIEIGVQSGNTDKLLTAAATEILKIFQIQGTKVAIQPTGDPLYKRGLITKYYTAVEEDFSSWGAFASSVKMQGSGLTKDRKLCRYTTVAQGPGSCVDDPKHPAGITASGTNPTPHRTIAVDRSYKGKTFFLDFMPYCNSNFNQELCKEWTGCYLGEDVGAASVIKGDHFDLYTGIGKTELNAVWGQIPDAADIYETNCEPGTGSMGAVVSSADAPLAGDAAVKGTEDILYTIRPAMKEKVLFNFEAIGDFEEEINILKETVSKCLGETATYEDIDACTKDKDIKDAGITKLQITEKEHTTSGFLIGLDATLNYKPKDHTEPLAIKMGVMLKDEYKPKESEVKLEKAEKTGMVTFSLTKSVSKDVQKYKITYKIKKKDDTDWPKKSSDLVEIPQDKMPGKLVIPNDVPTKPDEGNDFNWAANKANVTLSQGDEIELTIVAIDDSELSSEVSDKSRIQAAIPAE
ncbi:MAG: 3D domain-containing protein, partial [Nanoarchaeota archaeon]|nr:3D domain-containing protein [Nanoarchaeota archaeon]